MEGQKWRSKININENNVLNTTHLMKTRPASKRKSNKTSVSSLIYVELIETTRVVQTAELAHQNKWPQTLITASLAVSKQMLHSKLALAVAWSSSAWLEAVASLSFVEELSSLNVAILQSWVSVTSVPNSANLVGEG